MYGRIALVCAFEQHPVQTYIVLSMELTFYLTYVVNIDATLYIYVVEIHKHAQRVELLLLPPQLCDDLS